MADENVQKDSEKESDEVRKAHEEDVKKASKGPLSEIEKREQDIHPSGINGLLSGPGSDHKTGLNMVDLSVEEQAKRRNLR